MSSKVGRNSRSRVSGRSMEKENLTHIMKDKARKANLKIFSPRCRKIRVMGSLRKTSECGVSSTISLGTTLMNVSQYIHWWSRLKTKS
jgi:hypothetical protein